MLVGRYSSATVSVPTYSLELATKRDTQQITRALFLKPIAEIKPHVVRDLWPTFWFYVFAVCERFNKDLNVNSETDGAKIYQKLLERACKDKDQFQLIINSEQPNRIWRVQFCVLQAIHRLNPTAVNDTFPTWNGLPTTALRMSIRQWSEKWNLNADWCREFAFSIVKRCLFHEGIHGSFLHPHNPGGNPYLDRPLAQTLRWRLGKAPVVGKPNDWLKQIWINAAVESLQDFWGINEVGREVWPLAVFESREVLKAIVFDGREPRKLIINDFRMDGWNFLDESDLQFRRKASVKFRRHLATAEEVLYRKLDKDSACSVDRITSDEFSAVMKWRAERIKLFDNRLGKYLSTMRRARIAAIKKHRLVEVGEKPKLWDPLESTCRHASLSIL